MTRPIMWAIGTFVTIGIAASGAGERLAALTGMVLKRPEEQASPAQAASHRGEPPASAFDGTSRVETIRGDGRGHFAVDAQADGARINLLVDTGASLVVLREEDAERIGIFLRASDFTGRSNTANGAGRYAPVKLRWLRIGQIEIRDVEAAVVPRGQLSVNLLGMSFLKRLRSFDIADNRIALKG